MVAELLLILALATSCAHTETGGASYYGSRGGRTASGERVNPRELTAAHRTLRFGTLVKVTEVKSGKSVVVRINDRGPFIRRRVIDLTPAGFSQLAPLSRGVITVTVEVVKEAPPLPKRRSRGKRRR